MVCRREFISFLDDPEYKDGDDSTRLRYTKPRSFLRGRLE